MRFVLYSTMLVCFGVGDALAQDPFGNVTNEPRPSEFIHWDSESFVGFKSELEDQLARVRAVHEQQRRVPPIAREHAEPEPVRVPM